MLGHIGRRVASNCRVAGNLRITLASVALFTMASSRKAHKLSEHDGTITLEPKDGVHSATVIFMHGLGDTSEGWIDAAAYVFAPAFPHAKFILPTAPTRPITINMGHPMPGWYDIASLARKRIPGMKCDGLEESVARISKLIDDEIKAGIPAERIVLGGFSQGGAMTLTTGLNYPKRLAGMLVMSGYIPVVEAIKPNAESLQTPIQMLHGDEDEVLPLDFGKEALERVKEMGATDAKLNVYHGLPHSANDEELRDAKGFLERVIPSALAGGKSEF